MDQPEGSILLCIHVYLGTYIYVLSQYYYYYYY